MGMKAITGTEQRNFRQWLMIDANAVMGVLVYESEQAKPYLDELCGALETCIADPDNTAQWAVSMNELRHLLEEGV